MSDTRRLSQEVANAATLESFLDYLRAKFPLYIFSADKPFTLEFDNVELWVEITVDVMATSLVNNHFRLVVKRKCGVAEATSVGECMHGCLPISGSNEVVEVAQNWIIEQQRANPKEWRTAMSLKCDVPLFDHMANDLNDFSEAIIFCARDISPYFQFVSHSGNTTTVQEIAYWTKLCVNMRYKNEATFSVVCTRSINCPSVCNIEIIQFQFMHYWQYLRFGNNLLVKTLLETAQEWERRHLQEQTHTWLPFVRGREWMVVSNPLSDKNEQVLDSCCGALKSAGKDIRLFSRDMQIEDGEWKSISVSFHMFDEIKYYVTIDRESSLYRPNLSVHKYFFTIPFSINAEGYNTSFKKIEETMRQWIETCK